MKNIKIIFFFIFTTISCQEKKNLEEKINIEKSSDIIGHTFFKIQQNGNEKLLFKPCDANFANFKVYEDSIYHNWGQEYHSYQIVSLEKNENQTIYKTVYRYNKEMPETSDSLIKFEKIGKDNKFWKINGEIFIVSLFSSTISNISQACSECYEDCAEKNVTIDNSILKNWYGLYHLNTFKNDQNWETSYEITISIKNDSIIYEATGHQLYEKYLLKNKIVNENKIELSFDKLLDGSQSAVLDKTKSFGTINKNRKGYIWQSTYMDFNFNKGQKRTYQLKKDDSR